MLTEKILKSCGCTEKSIKAFRDLGQVRNSLSFSVDEINKGARMRFRLDAGATTKGIEQDALKAFPLVTDFK
eukprot:12423370-Karenia_brevis.AAC.1